MASRRKSGSSRSKTRTKKRPAKVRAQWRDDLSEQLSGHRGDMVAIVLVVVGILSLLAIVSDVVGPIGRGIDAGAAALLGRGKLLVPLALLVGAASLLLPARVNTTTTTTRRRPGAGCASVSGSRWCASRRSGCCISVAWKDR